MMKSWRERFCSEWFSSWSFGGQRFFSLGCWIFKESWLLLSSSLEALAGNLFFFLSGGEFLWELHPLSPSP